MELITKIEQMIETLKTLDFKGIVSFVAETKRVALLKRARKKFGGGEIPERYKTVTKLVYTTVSMGNNYQDAVNNRLAKEGKEANFKSKGTYCHPISDNKIIFKHNDDDRHYIRVYPNLCHSFKTVIVYQDAFGDFLTLDEFKEVEKKYLQGWVEVKENKSQGLDKDIIVNNYLLSNVKYIKRGDFTLNELSQEMIDKLNK